MRRSGLFAAHYSETFCCSFVVFVVVHFFFAGFSCFISCEACGSLWFLNACRLLKKIPIVSAFTFGEMAVTALVKEKGS